MKFRSKFQAIMWIATLLSLACLIAFQYLSSPWGGDLFSVLRTTALTCFYHFAVRLVIGELLVPMVDMRKIRYNRGWFRTREWEQRLYRRMGVQRWKAGLPTYNPSEFDLCWLGPAEVIRSTCRAEIVHELNVLASFVPLGFARWFGAFPAFLITSIAAAAFDLSFVILQRYNRPRLIRLLRARERQRREWNSAEYEVDD